MNTDGCKRTKLLLLFSLFVVCNIFLFALTIQRTSHSTQSQGFMVTQRPCYQRGSSWQDSAGNRTTRRPPYHRKETQTAVVWSCFPFIRSGQNHLQGTVEGGRRQDRQKKRWEDNIREWIGQEIIKSQRAVEDREKWRKLVVNSSVVPQRPSQLRGR